MKKVKNQNHKTSYQAVEDHFHGVPEQNELQFSRRQKQAFVVGSVAISSLILYILCFYLPLKFVPKPFLIHEIPKIKSLDIYLNPVLNEAVYEWTKLHELDRSSEDADLTETFETLIDMKEDVIAEGSRKGVKQDRLIVVGDIHGQQKELQKLLRKISFNKTSDTLLVLGDFISKGPDSLEVIDDLIELDAKCILGNHEYYVLQHYAAFHGILAPSFNHTSGKGFSSLTSEPPITTNNLNDNPEFLLAKKLQPRHVKYINLCPVMMLLGRVPLHSKSNNGKSESGHGLAVHAGLRWDLTQNLEDQDPLACLEMRGLIGPHFNETTDDSYEDDAVSWSKVWNVKHKEGTSMDDYVVYYGHDAHRGLNLKRWAKGLDTGCVKGGALSAMLIWQEKAKNGKLQYKESLVSVSC